MCNKSAKKSLEEVEVVVNPDPKESLFGDLVKMYSNTEGWALCVNDYETCLAGFAQYWFFVAIHRESREPLGTVSLARIKSVDGEDKEDVYSIGLYFVHPDWRGSGLGSKLFELAMDQAGDHNLYLMGVIKMRSLYPSKYGFDKIFEDEHRIYTIRTEIFVSPKPSDQYTTKHLKDVDAAALQAYDRIILPGYDRWNYIRRWLTAPGAHSRAAVDSSGKIVGVCCIREAIEDKLSVGPFYAENLEVARTLFHYTMLDIPHYRNFKTFRIRGPTTCTDAEALYTEMNLGKPCGAPFCSLQFTKKVLPAAHGKTFAMTESASSFI